MDSTQEIKRLRAQNEAMKEEVTKLTPKNDVQEEIAQQNLSLNTLNLQLPKNMASVNAHLSRQIETSKYRTRVLTMVRSISHLMDPA